MNMTAPENRLVTGRDNAGRFVKGVSGNLGGRPKGLASYVREIVGDDGKMLVDGVLELLRQSEASGKGGIQAQRFQLECIQWLADRGFGKAVVGVVHAEMTAKSEDIYANWSTEDLRALVQKGREALLANREAEALQEAKVIEGESHPVGVLESAPDAGDEAS